MVLSAVLIVGSVLMLAYVLCKIRSGKMLTSNAVFWFLFVVTLLIIALFPGIAFSISKLLGFQSPSNMVFVFVVVVLLVKELNSSVEIATLRGKLERYVQAEALRNHEEDNR